MSKKATVFLSLGSNIGNRAAHIRAAYECLEKQVGRINRKSRMVKTSSWGYDDADYLNSAIQISTQLNPNDLLEILQNIEKQLGRNSKTTIGKSGQAQYAPRVIDIDILFYDSLQINTAKLTVPHSLMHKRTFVLQPLIEIAPDFLHPITNKTVKTMLGELSETNQ